MIAREFIQVQRYSGKHKPWSFMECILICNEEKLNIISKKSKKNTV